MIKQLIPKGLAHIKEEAAKREETKRGILRAGNSGLLSDGVFTGACPRLAYLRSQGIETENKDSRFWMFEGGRNNEESWTTLLKPIWEGEIKREEEIQIEWTLSNGTKVTGRPDIVLLENGIPVGGMELKRVSSVWTATKILSGEPKCAHLIQLAHYSWKLSAPFELWYTSDVDWSLDGFAKKKAPKHGMPGSEYIEWSVSKEGEAYPKKILPFVEGFETKWNELGELEYRRGEEDWQCSIITQDRIKDFYEFVSQMESTQTLGDKPVALTAAGKEDSYSPCDYCALKAICKAETKFSTWKEACIEHSNNLT
jgi:hypothetical protein